jgi:hypothetical protein
MQDQVLTEEGKQLFESLIPDQKSVSQTLYLGVFRPPNVGSLWSGHDPCGKAISFNPALERFEAALRGGDHPLPSKRSSKPVHCAFIFIP